MFLAFSFMTHDFIIDKGQRCHPLPNIKASSLVATSSEKSDKTN